MNPNNFVVIFLFFGLSLLTAQEYKLSGTVTDSNNTAVAYANILLLNAEDSSIVNGTTSDDNGRFMFNGIVGGNYILQTSFIGFESNEQTLSISEDLTLPAIRLIEQTENLDEVTLVYKKPTFEKQADRLIFNIENSALTEGSMLQVLKSTPGVLVLGNDIKIKSGFPTVYINDRKVQLSAEELIQLLESSPANSVQSVEVITNPPASYDADSGSVINIKMSKNLVTGYRGSVFTNYTQAVFPRYDVGTSQFFKNKKVSLNLNYNYAQNKINRDNDDVVNYLDDANNIEEIWSSTINRNTRSKTHNLNLNFDYYIDDRNTLTLSSTLLLLPDFDYRINNNTIITDASNTFLSRFRARNTSEDTKHNFGLDLGYVHHFQSKGSLLINAHFTDYSYERFQIVTTDFFDSNNSFQNASEFNTSSNQDTQIITSKIDYNLPIDASATFETGIKYSHIDTKSDIIRKDVINNTETINPNGTNAFDYNESVFAAYANFSKEWSNWSLNVGIRAEQTNVEGRSDSENTRVTQDYLEWFPNVSVLFKVTENWSLYTNYKRTLQRPKYTNLNPFTFFLNENLLVVGNPNLQPVFNDHAVIGTSFLKHFTIEAYYSYYDGNIYELPRQDNDTNIITYIPVNIDSTIDYGFDLAIDFNVLENWYVYFVTSFYNYEDKAQFDGNMVAIEQWSNYSIFSNDVTFLKDDSLTANLTFTFVGEAVQALGVIDDRLFTDLSIAKSILNKQGTISLSAGDLFNYQDPKMTTRYLNQSSVYNTDLDNRYVKLGFRYRFGNTRLSTNERAITKEERNRLGERN